MQVTEIPLFLQEGEPEVVLAWNLGCYPKENMFKGKRDPVTNIMLISLSPTYPTTLELKPNWRVEGFCLISASHCCWTPLIWADVSSSPRSLGDSASHKGASMFCQPFRDTMNQPWPPSPSPHPYSSHTRVFRIYVLSGIRGPGGNRGKHFPHSSFPMPGPIPWELF